MTTSPVAGSADLHAWWLQAVGEEVAEQARPVRLDTSGQLHVRCLIPAWATQMRQLSRQVADRLTAIRPESGVAGLTVVLSPARLLVIGPPKWQHQELLSPALEDAWHDVTQIHGPHQPLVIVHGLDGELGSTLAAWTQHAGVASESHTPEWDICGPDCPADPNHRQLRPDGTPYCPTAGRRLNQQMIDHGADIILALIPPGSADLDADIRHARAVQIPVREIHSPDQP
ncbi:DciA family protein [Streptomyces sp. BRA346]|uniref:DciA family protein n=1 Tax=Streptomyces sp. BRA346 TaxID=2878199 RepID=UPI0040632F9F